VQAIAFSPDGKELATGGFDGSVKVWDLSFESLPRIESSYCMPPSVWLAHLLATSADLKYAALPTAPNQVEVFEVATGRSIAALPVPNRTWALAFDADASTVFGCALEVGQIWKWNWRQDTLELAATIPRTTAADVAFSPAARDLVVLEVAQPPAIYDTRTGDRWWSWPAEGRQYLARMLTFSPDGTTCALRVEIDLVSGGGVSRTVLLDLANRRLRETTDRHVSAIGNSQLAIGLADHSISLRDTRGGPELCRFAETNAGQQLTFSPDGKTLAVTDPGNQVAERNVATGMVVSQFKTANLGPVALRYSSDGRSLALIAANITHSDGAFNYGQCQIFVWSGTDEP
jgi:WD40 repeat protein